MKVGKPQSKRVPVRLRHKIQKASANKQRKERKEAKKNPQWRSRLKKDPGIPNLFPYKDKILAEIEESKRNKEEEKERRRDVARAQREGRSVDATTKPVDGDIEVSEEDDEDDDEEMDERENVNPMAALVASASQRAQAYSKEDDEEDNEEDNDADEEMKPAPKAAPKSADAPKKKLPKQVLDEPIKPVNRLLARLQKTPDGIQQLLEYYQLPPLVTAGSDATTRFLVDVARKRGRLSRGGVPNLHAAALTVLSDLQEQRLKLPALQQQKQQKASAATSKGEVQIVTQLAEPFRIEGLFGDEPSTSAGAMEM
ncbi:hypothetical protein CBER1_01333 [Cercospora berteroae]|uniref:Guanine nucleotide-binding protein-like 3 N-terminal domain-containing protein n=1 Tax=Cercospora berteroae TaxID=357750 RepID=A0A2S6CKN0_9PEZI|nr:hypothetical protein CBER1_01333 [Cercospora berteroae]